MGQYDSIATTALALVTKFGRALVLKRYSGTFEPVESVTTGITYTTQTIKAVKVNLKATDIARMSQNLKEALTKGVIEKYIVAAKGLAFVLDLGDVLEIDSRYGVIRGNESVAPSGIPIIYICFVEYANLSAAQKAATAA